MMKGIKNKTNKWMKQQNKNLQMNEQKAIENEKKTTRKIIIWNVIFCKSVKKEEKFH